MIDHGGLKKIGEQLRIMLWRVLIVRRSSWKALLLQFVLPLICPFLVSRLVARPEESGVKPVVDPATLFPGLDLTIGDEYCIASILLYTPTNNQSTGEIVESFKQFLRGERNTTEIRGIRSDEASFSEYMNISNRSMASLTAGVIFDENETDVFTYTIRSNRRYLSRTPFEWDIHIGPRNVIPCIGFAKLEEIFNTPLLEQSFPQYKPGNGTLIDDLQKIWMRLLQPSNAKPGSNSMSGLFPVAIYASFVIVYAIIIKRLSTEKSSQIREMYRITGLIDWIYWFTHLIDVYAVFLVQALIITFLYTFDFGGNGQTAYKDTSPIFIFFILALWGFNFILSAFALSIPFDRPMLAMTVGIIFWAVQTVPGYFVNPLTNESLDPISTDTFRKASCLLPNMAFTFAFNIMSQKEMDGSAAGFHNLFEPIPIFAELSLGTVLLFLIATTIIYIALIYYLVNVIPSQYGISKPWLFPIYSLFGNKAKKDLFDDEANKSINEYLEPLQPSDEVKVSIRNITKRFGGQQVNAVDNISLDIPHGQATMLLGENGAGKTTLMSMIIGLITPSRGTVKVNGHDILKETREARKSLNFCPQINILQPDLTVEQHLILYGSIKGVNSTDLESAVRKILGMIRLTESMNKKPSELSGGMCRRLNLGIALIGDSEVIVLDEPTSGLDPESRRAVWDILNEIKSERTILMTTHFIEEADAVGDRIAIIRKGSLACFGSPMFLKKIFGTGYELRIAKSEESNSEDITSVTESFFPEAQVEYAVGGEMIFALPQTVSDNSLFCRFFQELEAKKSDLKISSWGLSYTTLEDVFIRVIQSSQVRRDTRSESTIKISHASLESFSTINIDQVDSKQDSQSTFNFNSGFRLTLQRLKALVIKRLQYAQRYWKMVLFQMLLPSVMFAFIMIIDRKLLNLSPAPGNQVKQEIFSNPSNDNVSRLGDIVRSVMADEKSRFELFDPNGNLDEYMLEEAADLAFDEYTHKFLLTLGGNTTGPKVYFNGKAGHVLPIVADTIFDILQQYYAGNSSSSTKINTMNPFPFPVQGDVSAPLVLALLRPRVWIVLLQLTLPFLAANYILIPLHERSSRAKLIQIMTGLNPVLYWLGHLIFDMSMHIICTIFIYATVFVLNTQNIFNQDNMHVAFVLPIFFSGVASIPLAYIFSFVFDRTGLGYSLLLILYLVFSVITSTIGIFLSLLYPEYTNLYNRFVGLAPLSTMAQEIERIFTISIESSVCGLINPQFLQAQCSGDVAHDSMLRKCCTNLCSKTDDCFAYRDPLSWKYGILKGLLELFGVACFNFILLMVLEHYFYRFEMLEDLKKKFMSKIPYCQANQLEEKPNSTDIKELDSDVSAEEIRVVNSIQSTTAELSAIDLEKNIGINMKDMNSNDQDILSVVGLKKKYGNHLAVQGLSFGVHQNECFGLLGVNGAGKSTTFKMLVGDIRPTQGNAYIDQFNLVENKRKFQECIGYCPQYDALIDRLTAREMLFLIGRLRGMDERNIPEAVNKLIRDVDLDRHADKMTSFYSGGNKRKLSLAMALIAKPRVIFLDEPSSGVDAGNRRRMWSILSKFREKGCSLVLTTHSMEECETLCSRIAIMVNGKFRCLGSLQHLRHKFGQGYSLYIKIHIDKANDLNYVDKLKHAVEEELGAVLKQQHFVNLFYHIKDKSLKWSTLFQMMEEIKLNHQLEDYVISDTSLEQIFMDFAREQLSST